MGLKNKIKNSVLSSSRAQMIYNNLKANGNDRLNAFFCTDDRDDVLVMAYQYYLSSLTPQYLNVFDGLKTIMDDVKRHYDGANIHIQGHPDVTEYIGEDWGKNAEKCQSVLASQDYYLTMATYGARLYKDLSMKKVSGFNISVYKEIVAKVLNVPQAAPGIPHCMINGILTAALRIIPTYTKKEMVHVFFLYKSWVLLILFQKRNP